MPNPAIPAPPIANKFGDIAGLVAVLAVGLPIYGWIAAGASFSGGFSDSIDYLFMADFYRAALYGGALNESAEFYRATRFPPVFPMILGALGAGTKHQYLASTISCATAVLAALAIWWWRQVESPESRMAATMAAVSLLLYPAYFLLNLYVVSEPLAIMFLAIAFGLLSQREIGTSTLLTAALVIGLSPLVRTATLPAIPALIIWLAIRRPAPWPQSLMAIFLACAPSVAWAGYRTALNADSYAASLNAKHVFATMGGWPDFAWLPLWRMVMAFVDNWATTANSAISAQPVLVVASVVFILLSFFGCLIRIRNNRIDGWFLAGYIAMILVWPYPAELGRFLVVSFPLMIVCAISAAARIDSALAEFRREQKSGFAQQALAALIMFAIAPSAIHFSSRATLPIDAELSSEKREIEFFRTGSDESALQAAEMIGRARILASELKANVPKGECVYSVFPQMVMLHGEVPAASYPEGILSAQAAKEQLVRCDYFFVVGFIAIQLAAPPLYPLPIVQDWVEPVLISNMEFKGELRTAAALLRRRQQTQSARTIDLRNPATHLCATGKGCLETDHDRRSVQSEISSERPPHSNRP